MIYTINKLNSVVLKKSAIIISALALHPPLVTQMHDMPIGRI